MKAFKRITSVTLALALCLALCTMVLPVEALVASETIASGVYGGSLTWALDSEGTLTISENGYMPVFGPGMQNGAEVYAAPWFYMRNMITTAVIESGTKSIGIYAFYGCYNLTSVTIPGSVTAIEYGAFSACDSLEEVYYSGTESDLAQIVIENDNDALTNAKWYISSASSNRTVASGTCGDNLRWTLDDAGTLTVSGSGAMVDYTWNGSPWYDRKDTIKEIVLEYGVTSVGSHAFYRCGKLKSLSIPNSVTYIGDWSFYGCTSLTSVTIPKNVSYIDEGAFSNCTSLPAIYVDANNRSYTAVNGVLFTREKETLLCYPAGHSGSSYTIPDRVASIGGGAFEGSSITTVTIPRSVTYIGLEAFNYCNSLWKVNYEGSSSQRGNINIVTYYKGSYNEGNDPLLNASWNYNYY